ncbi:hypothetical protein GQ43DRAFT_372275 [Delitschia confertaspora ATCC 74209]|uniref:Uncharacterized protein n=1 Tax=Delitschia confertaspora ATCC 74209 TaxID=1513339 RepID=A0A9P4JMR1_9PLEO|nr:hypothetical protein GQ43DRAFT_372275 [Delitschia confertaspora ATCC 74209]
MSFSYTVHSINNSFDTLIRWYREFMAKTEQAFQAFHQRLVYLEKRLDTSDRTALSDAQVERVLRKILAERFAKSNQSTHQLPADGPPGGAFISNIKDNFVPPKPVAVDINKLLVDPNACPNPAWARDMAMLTQDLTSYPRQDPNTRTKSDPIRASSNFFNNDPNPPNKVHSNNAWS